MNHNLEYAIMIFLAGLLIILFLWSENGRYQANIAERGVIFIDTRTGNHWLLDSKEMISRPTDRR